MMRSLEEARISITKEDWKSALEALLQAWRKKRVVRIAELIDRVAERLPSEPIKAKTMKARHAAWLEASQSLDHAVLGPLLATPFPGRWQEAVPVATRLGEFRDDPRIAVALANFVVTEPYDSILQARPIFEVATDIIARHYEARAKATLEAHLERSHGYFWQYRGEEQVRSAIARMNEMPPDALDATEDAAVSALEALFSAEIKADAIAERSEADFLTEIYAAPNEDAPRAVYADWLTEHGDPRGEFIALQLAPNPTDKAKKREAALLKKHGAKWAGEFDRLMAKEARIFRRGFLAGGPLVNMVQAPRALDLARPEWALFEWVHFTYGVMDPLMDEVEASPWLRTLRGLTGLHDATAARFAREGLATQLEELGFALRSWNSEDELVENQTAIARGFPNLKTLSVYGEPNDAARLLAGPLPPRLERFVLQNTKYPLAEIASAVEKHVPGITLIEGDDPNLREDGEWHFELRRDASGHFTRLRAATRNPSRQLPDEKTLARVISSLPDLTELVVDRSGGCKWNANELAHVERAIAGVRALQVIEVPWDRAMGEAPSTEDGPRFEITLSRPGDIPRDVDAVFEAMASRSLSFDSMAVNDGAHKAIDGPKVVKEALTKKRTRKVSVYAKRTPTAVRTDFESWAFKITIPRGPRWELESWLTWLTTLLDRTEAQGVGVPFSAGETPARSFGPRGETLRWLWGVGKLHEPYYDFDELEAAFVETIPSTRVIRTKHLRLFLLGDRPEHVPTNEEHAALDARVTDILWRHFEKTQGYAPPKLVAEVLGSALEARGWSAAPNLTWSHGEQTVIVHISLARTEVGLRTETRNGESCRWEPITHRHVSTGEALRAALADFVVRWVR